MGVLEILELFNRAPDLHGVSNAVAPAATSAQAVTRPTAPGKYLVRCSMASYLPATGAVDPNTIDCQSQMAADSGSLGVIYNNGELLFFSTVNRADVLAGNGWFQKVILNGAATTIYEFQIEAWFLGS